MFSKTRTNGMYSNSTAPEFKVQSVWKFYAETHTHHLLIFIVSLKACDQGSKLRPFWSHMLPKCYLCDSKIYLGAFVRVQMIAVVRPLQFSAKCSRITAQHVPRDRELKQVKLFIRALV